MSKSIEVNDLNVYYDEFLAVEGVSLSIEPRSVTAFIGPVRLRQVDLPAHAQPHARGDPQGARRG